MTPHTQRLRVKALGAVEEQSLLGPSSVTATLQLLPWRPKSHPSACKRQESRALRVSSTHVRGPRVALSLFTLGGRPSGFIACGCCKINTVRVVYDNTDFFLLQF